MKLLWNSLSLAYKYEISLVWSEVDLVGNKVILPSNEASVLIRKQCHLLKLTDTKGPTYWGLALCSGNHVRLATDFNQVFSRIPTVLAQSSVLPCKKKKDKNVSRQKKE